MEFNQKILEHDIWYIQKKDGEFNFQNIRPYGLSGETYYNFDVVKELVLLLSEKYKKTHIFWIRTSIIDKKDKMSFSFDETAIDYIKELKGELYNE